jgi:two-component system phosphate regulon sensor histidine kinase PhoR
MNTYPKDPNSIVLIADPQINYLLERVLQSAGYIVEAFQDFDSAFKRLERFPPSLIMQSESISGEDGMDFAKKVIKQYPALPIVLLVKDENPELLKSALKRGISDYLNLPLRSEDILQAVENSLVKFQLFKEYVLLESRRTTDRLQRRVDELETLTRLAKSITGSLDIDSVLGYIVEAAVESAGAEEGSLLLLDQPSGELYMRASKNFQEDFVQTFRLPVSDTLAGNVMRSGQPVVLDDRTPQKIKTSYLVQSLIYVPLQYQNQTIGVLGVDNRHSPLPFQKRDLNMLSTLAEFAVIALANADVFDITQSEKNKLDTILKNINDGVIVTDQERTIVLMNQAAGTILNIEPVEAINKNYKMVFSQPEILELLDPETGSLADRTEMSLEDGCIINIQRTPIPEVGLALTLNDVSSLKKLDRIKSDFVNTVSYDLRSPLTAILGYAELVERAGPVNELQQEFIRRVQASVQNITYLVDDLVNLGRIEAGLDTRMEAFDLGQLLDLVYQNFKKAINRKGAELTIQLPENLPEFFGNPVQIRQMFEHLIDNSVKYSKPDGKISITGEVEQNQIIIQFNDSGIGIPPSDLPYIFDKFYRASNVENGSAGTGLGLAIVRSIVQSHGGRIWVESNIGEGTAFTIVLPVVEKPQVAL